MSKFKKLQKIYDEKYSHLPDSEDALLTYVIDEYNVDIIKVNEVASKIDSLKWNNIDFTDKYVEYEVNWYDSCSQR